MTWVSGMRILPILFNTDMVRALLEGRKTVTRRVVKPHHLLALGSPYHRKHPDIPDNIILEKLCCPPYIPGDILYVRETWSPTFVRPKRFLYKADADVGIGEGVGLPIKWHPSIHMPKEAARIFLRVNDVRAERLQDIDHEQAKAEGAGDPYDYQSPEWYAAREEFAYSFEIAAFAGLWDSTIKPADRDKYGWDANPWVWVIEFERVDKPEGW